MADWTPLGDRAIRFARPERSARAIVHAVRAWPGVVDVVVARGEVAAYFSAAIDRRRARAIDDAIRALASAPDDPAPVHEHVLRARYDGPDLAEVARALAMPVDEVCTRHAAAIYTVETMGFAPGFAYLSGLDPALELPRRATPRTRVASGAIAIAGRQTAVYPFDSPGGWHWIGAVIDAAMFGADGPLLQLGDRVRFARCGVR